MSRTIWRFLALVPGEKLITKTNGDQRNEEAGFRHLRGIWWDLTPEYQKYTHTHTHTYIHPRVLSINIYIHTYVYNPEY